MKLLLALLLFASTANAAPFVVTFLNECPDLTNNDWSCLNRTQAAQRGEVIQQVATALKNTRYKKPIRIYSIDPILHGKYNPDYFALDNKAWYEFGAWVRKGKVYFAAMPGCPNARRVLERLLRRL